MALFWIMTGVTTVVVGAIMGWVAWTAHQVEDKTETRGKHRLPPDLVRILAYVLVFLVALLAALYELSLYYGPGAAPASRP